MQLYIGNKNYSSWSMRPWVLMRQAGIGFEEVKLRFDAFTADSQFKTALARVSPAGRVPVLVDGGLVVWDSLAIAEYLAERQIERDPERPLWPAGRAARARARSICAEMHAGFGALRRHLPMNIEARLPEIGARVLREQDEVRDDIARIVQMWSELLSASGGPLLFGAFSIADAYYAPVAMRFVGYGVALPPAIERYVAALCALPAVAAWVADARAEADFVAFDEPYRLSR